MKKSKAKRNTRTRGNMLDWMQPLPGEETKPAKDRKYYLLAERSIVLTQWARNGLTKDEIAGNMNISSQTLYEWQKKCPDISECLKNARAYAHARVENALYQKAIGYTVIKQQPVKKKVADYDGVGKKIGEHEEIELIEVTEQLPPDMGAIAFYLKNNMPEKYKDKWPETDDREEEQEQENMCLRDFTKAVAKAVISENKKNG
jgi:transposase